MSQPPDFCMIWYDEMRLDKIKNIAWSELKDGIHSCLENAERLRRDADFLYEKGRMASAAALYVAAWEEMGKAILLLKHWKRRQYVKGSSWEQIFRKHSKKQTAVFDDHDLLWGKSDTKYGEEEIEKLKDCLKHTKEVLGLYVNHRTRVGPLFGQKVWSCPSDDATRAWAGYLRISVQNFLLAVPERIDIALKDSDS